MRTGFLAFMLFVLTFGSSWAQSNSKLPGGQAGFYSHEGNNGAVAQSTGHNHYIKFYPGNRIIRLYIPYPYAKTVKSTAVNTAFDQAAKKSAGSAYIRDTFVVMDEPVIAHLDFYRNVDGQVMYDCGNASPCRISFNGDTMTVIQPGVVLDHKIEYRLIRPAN